MSRSRLGLTINVAVAALALASPALAQPPHPASRFNGTWTKDGSGFRFAENPPLNEAAKARIAALRPQDEPGARCVEPGLGRMMAGPGPWEIFFLNDHIVVVAEFSHPVRRIWTNQASHDPDFDPGYYGESIARWDGDTLVVDTVGFNGRNNLDPFGTPMGPKMHVVERWRLRGPDKLEIEYTFDDPDHYTRPWKGTLTYSRNPKERLLEYTCNDDNRNDPTNAANPKAWTSTEGPQARVLMGQDIFFPDAAKAAGKDAPAKEGTK